MGSMETRARTARETVTLLRHCLTALSALCALGTATELAMYRHWDTQERLIPWYTLGVLVIAQVMFVIRPTAKAIHVIRGLLGLVAISSMFGIYAHIHENYIAGPLDYRYSDKWDSMSTFSQYWHAFSKTVGPAPTLAAGVLFQSALLLFVATLRHPAFRRKTADAALAEAVSLDLQDVIRSASLNGSTTSDETEPVAADHAAGEMDGEHRRTVVDVLTHTVLDLRECAATADGESPEATEAQP